MKKKNQITNKRMYKMHHVHDLSLKSKECEDGPSCSLLSVLAQENISNSSRSST